MNHGTETFIVANQPVLVYICWNSPLIAWTSQQKQKKGSFGSDLLAAPNGINRNNIMHHFTVNQIPTEQGISRAALHLTDEVGYCSSAWHRVIITDEMYTLYG